MNPIPDRDAPLINVEDVDLSGTREPRIPSDRAALLVHKTNDLSAIFFPAETSNAILGLPCDPMARVVAAKDYDLPTGIEARHAAFFRRQRRRRQNLQPRILSGNRALPPKGRSDLFVHDHPASIVEHQDVRIIPVLRLEPRPLGHKILRQTIGSATAHDLVEAFDRPGIVTFPGEGNGMPHEPGLLPHRFGKLRLWEAQPLE